MTVTDFVDGADFSLEHDDLIVRWVLFGSGHWANGRAAFLIVAVVLSKEEVSRSRSRPRSDHHVIAPALRHVRRCFSAVTVSSRRSLDTHL